MGAQCSPLTLGGGEWELLMHIWHVHVDHSNMAFCACTEHAPLLPGCSSTIHPCPWHAESECVPIQALNYAGVVLYGVW